MKFIARFLVVSVLGWQVRRLREKHVFKIVGVVGSIGKTSTKRAIAESLGSSVRVRYQAGNYNDLASVPLVFFGQELPSLFNPFAWLKVFVINERILSRPYPFDVVVVEVGTDGPGQIATFSKYLHLDVAVVTAIAPEHMEYFSDLDAVAAEELSVRGYADKLIVNADLVDEKYLKDMEGVITYSIRKAADYRGKTGVYKKGYSDITITKNNKVIVAERLPIFSEAQLYSAVAASSLWDTLGLELSGLAAGLSSVTPVPGRMQLLDGIKGATIIDDSYNASPGAVISSLDTIYKLPADHKIAVLGNMNELGSFSKDAHIFVGEHCSPKELDEVITIGPDANAYLAQAARDQGCRVSSYDSPYEAGEYLKTILRKDSLVLVKGSQNRVFAEEAIKSILANPEDSSRLVRQSRDWMAIKQSQFSVPQEP